MQVPLRLCGKKVIDTREGALDFPRTKCGPTIREQDAHRRRASRRGDDGAARGAFLSPTRANPGFSFVFIFIFVFLLLVSSTSSPSSSSSSSYSASSFFAKTTKATRRSRGRRRKTHSHRCTGERNDSSRRRAVLPRTSHPWFPPALEPLNYSVVQRFEASVVLNASANSAVPPRRERQGE